MIDDLDEALWIQKGTIDEHPARSSLYSRYRTNKDPMLMPHDQYSQEDETLLDEDLERHLDRQAAAAVAELDSVDTNTGSASGTLPAQANESIGPAIPREVFDRWRESQKTWQARNEVQKAMFDEAKKRIRETKREERALVRGEKKKLASQMRRDAQRGDKPKRRRHAPLSIRRVVASPAEIARREQSLRIWSSKNGPSARKLRGKEAEIMNDWILYQRRRAAGEVPTPSSFAEHLKLGGANPKSSGQKRLNRLGKLELPGGPWHLDADTAERYRHKPLFGTF